MRIPNSIKWLGLAIVVILALVFLARSCNLYDQISVLKGKHEALQIAYADMDLKSREAIDVLKEINKKYDEAMKTATYDIANLKNKIKTKDEKILNLEEEFTQLGGNKDAQIVNLQAQIAVWKEKFTLAEGIIADKDSIIFSLTAKYDAQVKISAEWEASYHRQVELHSICLERLAAVEKEWRGIRFGSKIKTYLVGAAVGWIVYSQIKK